MNTNKNGPPAGRVGLGCLPIFKSDYAAASCLSRLFQTQTGIADEDACQSTFKRNKPDGSAAGLDDLSNGDVGVDQMGFDTPAWVLGGVLPQPTSLPPKNNARSARTFGSEVSILGLRMHRGVGSSCSNFFQQTGVDQGG